MFGLGRIVQIREWRKLRNRNFTFFGGIQSKSYDGLKFTKNFVPGISKEMWS
jgi:hypothetical protein